MKAILKTLFALLVAPSMALAASQGPLHSGTINQTAFDGSSTVWTNPSNIASSNDVYATSIAANGGVRTHWLEPANFGFSVPAGATINGITVVVEQKADTTAAGGTMWAIQLMKAGVRVGTDQGGSSLTTSDNAVSLGNSSDLWGTTWTDSDINASTFGVSFHYANGGSGTTNVSVDDVRITVDYTATSGVKGFMTLGVG